MGVVSAKYSSEWQIIVRVLLGWFLLALWCVWLWGGLITRCRIVRGLWGLLCGLGLIGLYSGTLHVADAHLVKPSGSVLTLVGVESQPYRQLLALLQIKLGDVVLAKHAAQYAVGMLCTAPCEVLEQILLTLPGVARSGTHAPWAGITSAMRPNNFTICSMIIYIF